MNTFAGMSAIPQPLPVFLHEGDCEWYAEDGGYPERLLELGAVFDGYNETQLVVRRETVLDGGHIGALGRILENDSIRYVIVRDAKAGCYDFRVERVD